MLLRHVILSVAGRPGMERFVRNSRLTRRVVRRFIAGETVESALEAVAQLRESGFRITLDLLGENVRDCETADRAADAYVDLLERIANSPYHGGFMPENVNVSVKLTQLGLLQDEQAATRRLERIVQVAAGTRNFVRVDMEDSQCTDATLRAVLAVHSSYRGHVGTVLQSMLYRTEKDLEDLIHEGVRIRLVKGAYAEPESIAYQSKRDVDNAFLRYGRRLLEDGIYPAFGTHDHRLMEALIHHATEKRIGRSRYEFQLLYGIRRDVQRDLLKRGYIVRVYVPYGEHWYPYFTRRLAERPANLAFFLRALVGR
ncbi:MAG: proline dehydrogenase [Armatimonadetes bacterium]|nr:MAG: proline dehydrogenase [Armatimonadota bacterium]